MASILPNTPGTGSKIPITQYTAGITELFPNVNRKRIVETAINSRDRIDIMPVNSSLQGNLSDRYIEFRIKSSEGVFLDMGTLALEMKITFGKKDGSEFKAPTDKEDQFGLVNGISNTIFKCANVFLNGKLVESTPLYNYISYIKLLRTTPPSSLESLGKCGGLRDDYYHTKPDVGKAIIEMYTESTIYKSDIELLQTEGIEVCFPLVLDVASLDMYLLDNVDVGIRLELANQSWYMGAPQGGSHISTNIEKAVLWVDKVIPHYNAMQALSQSIQKHPIEYIFDKTLLKTYAVGSNENNIVLDQPFNNVIPEKLTMCFVENTAFNGTYKRNPLFFPNLDISQIRVSLNGNDKYTLKNNVRSYYETLRSNNMQEPNMITYPAFLSGRCIYTFNFLTEEDSGTIPVEMSANLRISIDFNNAPKFPHIILLIGDSVGLLSIDKNRHIQCDIRA